MGKVPYSREDCLQVQLVNGIVHGLHLDPAEEEPNGDLVAAGGRRLSRLFRDLEYDCFPGNVLHGTLVDHHLVHWEEQGPITRPVGRTDRQEDRHP